MLFIFCGNRRLETYPSGFAAAALLYTLLYCFLSVAVESNLCPTHVCADLTLESRVVYDGPRRDCNHQKVRFGKVSRALKFPFREEGRLWVVSCVTVRQWYRKKPEVNCFISGFAIKFVAASLSLYLGFYLSLFWLILQSPTLPPPPVASMGSQLTRWSVYPVYAFVLNRWH
jgi:hypothetical protein